VVFFVKFLSELWSISSTIYALSYFRKSQNVTREKLCRLFLEVCNSIFLKTFLFDIQNNEYFLHKTTFMKILARNGSFASFESTFEFPTKILA